MNGLIRRQPEIDFALPQDTIPDGLADPEVLAVAASLRRTHDVRTMPKHFKDFVTRRRDCPGVIVVPGSMPVRQAIDEILLIWHASEAKEWANLFRRLPL